MKYTDIHGWFGFHATYDTAFNKYPNGTFVEVGAWKGKSAVYMAQKIKESKTDVKFYAVDTFLGSEEHQAEISGLQKPLIEIYLSNIVACGVFNYVQTLQLPSVDAATTFKDKSVDFVFIDGDHSYEAVKADIEAWLPKVRPGGLIAGDDYSAEWFGVIQAVDELLPQRTFIDGAWAFYKP